MMQETTEIKEGLVVLLCYCYYCNDNFVYIFIQETFLCEIKAKEQQQKEIDFLLTGA
jgi:hypothetical protein